MAVIRCFNHDRFGACVGEVEVFVEHDAFGTTLVLKTERDEIRITPVPDLYRMAAETLQAAERLERARPASAAREVA